MSVSFTPVPAPRQSGDPDSGEPLKPAATVTSTSWPWNSPSAWAFPPPRSGPRHGDGARLIALRGFWAGRYEISIRRRWLRKEWLAVREDGSRDPLRGRGHAALSQALYADWLAETAREAHARVAADRGGT